MVRFFGIYGEKWQRIASSFPRILSFEQRSEGRRFYSYVHKEQKTLVKIQDEVTIHQVSKALADINKWSGYVEKGTKKGIKLAESQVFMYFHILKITKHFISVLDKIAEHVSKRSKGSDWRAKSDSVMEEVVTRMYKALQDAENEGGKDMKTLMAYMNEELDKKPGDFIANVITSMKNRKGVSILSRLSLRIDIRVEFRDMKALKDASRQLEAYDREFEKTSSQEKVEKTIDRIATLMLKEGPVFEEMFRVAHLVIKRDLLLLVMVASDERVIHHLGLQWVHQNFLPETPFKKSDVKIAELNRKLSEKAHNIASGLNVIIKGMDRLKTELGLEIKKIS